jgi:hypothetical protein
MKEELQIAINFCYKQWCEIHDPFEDDFEDEVYKVLPNIKITYDTHNLNYIVL